MPTRPIHVALGFALLSTLADAASASAAQFQPFVRSGEQTASPGRRDPYRQLFQPEDKKTPPSAPSPSVDRPQPRVVCGMTIVPADPTIDPKIAVKPRPDDTTRYAIRGITPPICK